MCVSSDDQILYISWIHVEHILTQWLHFTFYKELECALASVLLLGNQGYVLYTYSYYLLLFTKALVCSFREPYIVYIRDTCWTDDWTLISTEITFYLYKELECVISLCQRWGIKDTWCIHIETEITFYLLQRACTFIQMTYFCVYQGCWTHIDDILTYWCKYIQCLH